MPGKALNHPERDILSAFGLGKLPPEEAREVEAHITECEPCCKTLLDLQSDTFVDLVRSSNRVQSSPDGSDALRCETSSQPPGGAVGVAGRAELPAQLANHPRYRTVELLGRGGMGDVYRAEHRLMNRTVALKVINQELLAQPTVAERFRREVRAAAQLTHPNIVTAYDAEQAGAAHFLVMEYVDGIDLAAFVRQQGPLSVEVACDFIRQAAVGLQHAHECGMVHRDIKPHNLMVTSDGRVKILDFGLAILGPTLQPEAASPAPDAARTDRPLPDDPESTSLENRLTSFGCTMGTPDFISPEQADNAHAADARSDIYSLGCTLYYLLAGRPPFPEGTAAEKLEAHSRRQPRSIGLVRDDIPQELADVLSRAMAKDPAVRFQTPADLAAAVEPFAAPQGPSRPEAGKTRDAASAPRRGLFIRRASAIGAAIALLAFAVVFFVRLGETTIRFEVDAPNIAVHFVKDRITLDNDGGRIHIKPGRENTFVVARKDGTEVIGRSFRLKKGQKVVLRVSNAQDGRIHIGFDANELRLSDAPPPAALSRVATSGSGSGPGARNVHPNGSRPPSSASKKGNPNVNASQEYPGVFHSPSADATPSVFRSILQLEVVIKRGRKDAQVEYANGTVVSTDGLIVSVLDEPSADPVESLEIMSAAILTLDGSSAAAELVDYEPAYGLAIFRTTNLDLPCLTLSKASPVANRRITWHTVYKDGPKTYLYTRPLRIHKSTHQIAETKDVCQIIDLGSSALSAERSGSALVSLDGTLLGLMGRQEHWRVTPRDSPPRKKTAWAVPAHVIAGLIANGRGR